MKYGLTFWWRPNLIRQDFSKVKQVLVLKCLSRCFCYLMLSQTQFTFARNTAGNNALTEEEVLCLLVSLTWATLHMKQGPGFVRAPNETHFHIFKSIGEARFSYCTLNGNQRIGLCVSQICMRLVQITDELRHSIESWSPFLSDRSVRHFHLFHGNLATEITGTNHGMNGI